jgi:mono/diheme cytochrome c family protein
MQIRPIFWSVVVLCVLGSSAIAAPSTKKKKNARPSDAERGKELFERHCVACHGELGDGKGPMASSLVQEIPNLRGLLTKETLDSYVKTVQTGKKAMPGFELSFDQHDTRRVLRTMIKRMNPTPEVAKPEEKTVDTEALKPTAAPPQPDGK